MQSCREPLESQSSPAGSRWKVTTIIQAATGEFVKTVCHEGVSALAGRLSLLQDSSCSLRCPAGTLGSSQVLTWDLAADDAA